MPGTQDYRQIRNQDYWNFIAHHKITNVQSADSVAEYFCSNIKSKDFSNPTLIYEDLVGGILIDEDETALDNVTMLVNGALKANNSSAEYLVSRRSNFVDISAAATPKDKVYSVCKLWLNVKHEYYPILVQEIMNHLAKTPNTNPTDFKISTSADRNDYISIYTDYANAGPLIASLKQLKEKYPNLFEPRAKENPLIAQVDDVVSYADVGHDVSYPKTIAVLLSRINLRKDEIMKTRPELRQLKAKKILLETILEDACELKSSPNVNKTYLICPSNLSSIRSSQGIPYRDLTDVEIDKEIEIIQSQIAQVNMQARKISDKLKQDASFTV